ncbi:MAG: sulfurtransferase complex subunit TusB [Gammaproteobacteria bacterium]|nr:MAG: sulfurtransferase complex subunit TusB [Gammaproteobacteria bacterium]
MLHIISTTSGHEILFARIAPGDTLLFIASAVTGLHKKSLSAQKLLAYCQYFHCYVLEADLLARGLTADDILADVKLVDYPGFVTLTLEHKVIKTWN